TAVFTNQNAILTQNMLTGWGMYNSGGNNPVGGGLNGTCLNTSTDHVTDGVQQWQGYWGQLAFTGTNSRMVSRASQSAGADNRNQDLVTTGSSSQSYATPAGAAVGSSS